MRKAKKLFSLILSASMLAAPVLCASAEKQMSFDDVKENDWFYSDVKTAYETGLIDGKSDTAYAPDDNMTYAEAIKLAACMNQYVSEGKVSLQNGDPWYQTYVDYAKDNGIISKDYDYTMNASRSGYMEIFASCLPDENLKEINSIADDSIPDVRAQAKYAPAVYKLYRAGILTGVDDDHNCNPSANIRRSEVAAILTRMMNADKRVSFSLGSEPAKTEEPKNSEEPAKTEEPVKTEEPKSSEEPAKTEEPKSTEAPADGKLAVLTQPESVTVAEGADATFTVAATGGKAPYTYEWYYRYNDKEEFYPCKGRAEYYEWFNGVDAEALTVKMLDGTLAGSEYRCVVTDANGDTVTSEAAKLSAEVSIKIENQPASYAAEQGKDADFFVSVNGGKTPYKFQWYYCNAGETSFTRCEDAAEWYERYSIDNSGNYSVLTVRKVGEAMKQDGAMYFCVITDEDGYSVTSNTAVLTLK